MKVVKETRTEFDNYVSLIDWLMVILSTPWGALKSNQGIHPQKYVPR